MRGRLYRHFPTQTKPKAWYQRDGGNRLAHDRERIAAAFPSLSYRIDEQGECVFLEGTITLVAECGISTPIQVRIQFPDSYPKHEPRVYDAAKRFPCEANRHIYPDGQCCLWLPPESRWNADDPDGLRRFLEEVAVFFDQQLAYDALGRSRWPGKQRSHGDSGYVEFVQELLGGSQQLLKVFAPVFANRSSVKRNSPCPCGSGIKYKKCHLWAIEEITRRVGLIKLYTIFGRWFTNVV